MSAAQRTEISELGEFGLIRRLTERFKKKHGSTVLGVGDDAAVIRYEGERQVVVTTDLLLEGIHFDLMYVPLKHLGYKAVVVNLSDVYAMNATPRQITVSIGVSNRFSVEALEELYAGIYAACRKYDVDMVGGDTSSSVKGMVISVTAIGEADANRLVRRSGAAVNELICVTGDLGSAYLGLQLLEREKRIFLENPNVQPDLEGQAYVVGRQLKPEARRDVIEWLAQADILPTSMIDISDGLSSEVLHLCEASGTGCRLYEEKIPIAEEAYQLALKFHLDPITCALHGGEDYELLFTIRQQDYEKIKNHPDISVIGHMQDASLGCQLITKGNNVHTLTALGWNAFRKA
ncbi:MAG: thiamine-phosphate kinase [Chitinophagales bacterium]|nr:thiamine-phosphate kinase [Chitinophagales bacterium]MDW8428611.1 thiamine-phosphate kinase [Chitinophagales bacterium]